MDFPESGKNIQPSLDIPDRAKYKFYHDCTCGFVRGKFRGVNQLCATACRKEGHEFESRPSNPGTRGRDEIPLLLGGKIQFQTGLDGICLPMQLPDWPLVEAALLLIGLKPFLFRQKPILTL